MPCGPATYAGRKTSVSIFGFLLAFLVSASTIVAQN
jgi:hypothetical protein